MNKDLGCRNVLGTLLAVAIVLTSIIINSEGRPMTQEDNLQMKTVLELSNRDDLVQIAGYGEEKLSTVLIVGTLVCYKNCLAALHKNHQLYPQPIPGTLVGAVCTNHKDKRATWVKAVTNEYGEFRIDLPSHLHAIPKLDEACSVRALHIPKNSPCYQSAYARKQTKMTLSSLGNGVRTYTTGIIALINETSKNSEVCMKGLDDQQEMT